MKGATLLAKSNDFGNNFREHLKLSGFPIKYDSQKENGFRIEYSKSIYFTFYDCIEVESIEEEFEIPIEVLKSGFRYEYSIECRCEVLFCDILRHVPNSLDILIMDADGVIFQVTDLDPSKVVL